MGNESFDVDAIDVAICDVIGYDDGDGESYCDVDCDADGVDDIGTDADVDDEAGDSDVTST